MGVERDRVVFNSHPPPHPLASQAVSPAATTSNTPTSTGMPRHRPSPLSPIPPTRVPHHQPPHHFHTTLSQTNARGPCHSLAPHHFTTGHHHPLANKCERAASLAATTTTLLQTNARGPH